MNQEVEPSPSNVAKQWATLEEVRQAIDSLDPSDHAKLTLISRTFARRRLRGDVVEPRDLLQEAVWKTLDGRRHWNKKITMIKHLDRVMESDSSHIAEHRAATQTESISDNPDASICPPGQSSHVATGEEVEDLFDLFVDDEAACDLLRLKGEGMQASEIQGRLGLSKTQYQTVTKRIRRRVVQHLLLRENTNYGTKS